MKRKLPFSKELFDEFTEHELTEKGFTFKMKEAKKEFSNFVFFHQWWKSKNTESIISHDFVIATDKNLYLILDKDLTQESAVFYLREAGIPMTEIMQETRFLRPETDLNKTINASWIKRLDEGKVSITDIGPLEKELEFIGEHLNARYKASRKSEASDFWHIQAAE